VSDDNVREVFRQNLNKLFEQNDVTQKALADYVGVSTASVSDWRKGKILPRLDRIDKICLFFHVERSDLLNTFDFDDKDTLKKYASSHPTSLHYAEHTAIEGNNGYVKFEPKDKFVYDIADSMQKILNAITKENKEHPPSITPDEQALLDAYRNASERDKNLVDTILRISEK
jgi:transcriptional regulator with XRE-family HTH domain